MALSGIESTSSVLTTILEFRSRMKKSSPLLSARHLFLLLSFALLAACETVPDVKNDHDLLPRTARKCSETAELSGRVSMNYTLSHNDRAESMHGRFTWKQNRHATKIALFSPLGQTMAIIDISPGQAVFTASGKPPVTAASADELVFRQLGWPLPVSGMRNWLQGCATDTGGQPAQADPAHPEITTQDGWHLHYIGWIPYKENEILPRRIDMTHTPQKPAAVSAIHIRLVIDDWLPEN